MLGSSVYSLFEAASKASGMSKTVPVLRAQARRQMIPGQGLGPLERGANVLQEDGIKITASCSVVGLLSSLVVQLRHQQQASQGVFFSFEFLEIRAVFAV